jgi:SAM-dependent methyltransferase
VTARYDTIGRTYTRTRRADPRIAAQIAAALGDARTVVNVGGGAGSYEPSDRVVVGVDPSRTMLAQRRAPTVAVQGVAEQLPFTDDAFDAAMATLTLHHWTDVERGLAEMRRVAARQVILFFDPAYSNQYWLVAEYCPEVMEITTERAAPDAARIGATLDVLSVEPVLVPADCTDGFGGAYWNRPERYLDPEVQAGISSFSLLDPALRERATQHLRADIESGAWDAKHGELRALDDIDLGYRLLVAGS